MADEDKKSVRVTYRPMPGDDQTTEFLGTRFKAGEAKDVDVKHADKLRAHPLFAVEGEETYGDDIAKQREQEPEPEDEISFDEAQAAAYREEYGTDDPEEVEDIRRERENAQVRAPRRPGRPRKVQPDSVSESAAERAAAHDADRAEREHEKRS